MSHVRYQISKLFISSGGHLCSLSAFFNSSNIDETTPSGASTDRVLTAQNIELLHLVSCYISRAECGDFREKSPASEFVSAVWRVDSGPIGTLFRNDSYPPVVNQTSSIFHAALGMNRIKYRQTYAVGKSQELHWIKTSVAHGNKEKKSNTHLVLRKSRNERLKRGYATNGSKKKKKRAD